MSTPEAVDPLAQLAADEAAERETQEQAQAAPPQADNAPEPQADAEPNDTAPWQQHGFKDPTAVFQAWENAANKIREQGAELGELRRYQREMANVQQQAQQPQQAPAFPDGTPIYDAQTIQQAVEDGTISELQASMVWSEQAARLQAMQMEERLAQRLAPIEQMNIRAGAQDALDTVKGAVGDEVIRRHAGMIGKLVQQDAGWFADPSIPREVRHRRLLDAVKSAEWDHQQNGASQPRNTNGQYASPADTFVEGGSGAQGPVTPGGTRLDPEEQHLINTLIPQHAVDEAGIKIPWAR